ASVGSADGTIGFTRCGQRQSGDQGRRGSRAAAGRCCQGWAGAPGKGGDSRWLLAEQQRVVTLRAEEQRNRAGTSRRWQGDYYRAISDFNEAIRLKPMTVALFAIEELQN